MSLKKMLIKRIVRKNIKRIQKDIRKSYSDMTRNLSKKMSVLKNGRYS